MEKERIYQLREILRHVKTREMGKLKFMAHFGLSQETIDYIKANIFFSPIDTL